MAPVLTFKPGQIILAKYYDAGELVLVYQTSQWYNGNWEHGFVQIAPPTEHATTVIIMEWEVGCGAVKIMEDGSTLKVLYGTKEE